MKTTDTIYKQKSNKQLKLIAQSRILFFCVGILLYFSSSEVIQGQEFKYYTQYMFNGLAINPAYAGIHNSINITGNIRKQWVGFEGAPSMQTLSVHSPFFKNQFGLGLLIINDKIGVSSQQEVSINYSYKLNVADADLSLGLKMGFNHVKNEFTELNIDDYNDLNFLNDISSFVPVFGFGAYYKTSTYYAGLSIPYLYKHISKHEGNIGMDNYRTFLLTGGYIYQINKEFKIRPSVLMMAQQGSSFNLDLNTNLYYRDDYCVGISYKLQNSIAILFEAAINKTYYIGYSYDIATTTLIKQQSGTHEFSLNVFLNRKDNNKIPNPRYF